MEQSSRAAELQSCKVCSDAKKILFLISDTGGGHRAAATAMAQAIHRLYPEHYSTIIHDIWSHETGWPVNQMPGLYPWLTTNGQFCWRLLWATMSKRWLHEFIFSAIRPLLQNQLTHYLQQQQPNLIVSVHPLMNSLGVRMRERAGLNIPFVTVITDLITIHSTWVYPEVDTCFVPTDVAYDAAVKYGMSAAKLKQHGYPVRLEFIDAIAPHPRSSAFIRVPPKILLLSNNNSIAIARALLERIPDANLWIVTGQDQSLYQQLQRTRWPKNVQLYGFVENMATLMNEADLLITKAGPGVISEAILLGLPMILSSYIPGQEEGNVDYVQANQLGAYMTDPSEIAQLAQQWLSTDGQILSQMSANAQRFAKPNAVFEIAEALCGLC